MNPINTSLKNLAISRQQPKSIEVENKKAVEAVLKPIQQPISRTVEVMKPKPVELLKEPEEMATWLQKGIGAVKKVAKPLARTAVNAAGGAIGMPTLGTNLISGAKAVSTANATKKLDVTPVKGGAAITKAVENVQTRAMEQQTTEPTFMTKVTENVKKNWMYYLGGLVVAFLVYWFFGKKKVAVRRRRRRNASA